MSAVNIPDTLALGIILGAALLVVVFSLLARKINLTFRSIPAMTKIRRAASTVVEDGTRLHVSLGSANPLTPAGASALAGLGILTRLARTTSLSDLPPVATSGNPIITLVSQDTLRAAHDAVASEQVFDRNHGRMTGLTPLSYVAGVMPAIRDERISTNIIIGNFGPEVGLLTEAADRQNVPVIAASDSLPAQAALYVAAEEPLLGEELFAVGAYDRAGNAHTASLLAQDIFRWLILLALLAGAGLKFMGIL
jgi:hypothetical protein